MEEGKPIGFKPFTPLAKPLGPLDPMPVFDWQLKMIYPKGSANGCTARFDKNNENERSTNMDGITLGMMMKLTDNATGVRIDVMGEEMALTPHRLALYASWTVKKIFVNIAGELEMELEER